LIETDLEKTLGKENSALNEYKTVLASQLTESNVLLSELKTEEVQLHEKLFEIPGEVNAIEPRITTDNGQNEVITTDDPFEDQLTRMETQLQSLNEKARRYNALFGNRLHLQKSDLPKLLSLPTTPPVKNLVTDNFVSGFGVRINPFHKGNYHHDGVDIALTKGSEVIATGKGRVSYFSTSTLEAGYGNYVEIDHGNGVLTRYSHLEKISVTWGQKIKQGQVIGLSGSSGGSVAPHLHYEVIKNGKNLDPLFFMLEGINAAQHQQLAIKSKVQNQSFD
jgi:murein DD-endopeptidase MepM/ murein hydrolase activator NlpD